MTSNNTDAPAQELNLSDGLIQEAEDHLSTLPDEIWLVHAMASFAQQHAAQLLSENAELREVIAEALEPGVFAMEDRSGIHTSEDEMVMNLGRRIGFGALMDSASRMWAIVAKDNDMEGSEYTCGPCAAVRRSWVEKAKKALGETK